MLVIYTSRIGRELEGDMIDLNTTVKSGSGMGRCFAPTWELVGGSKAFKGDKRFAKYKPLSWEAYTDAYTQLMRQRYAGNRPAWDSLIEAADDRGLVLRCYCQDAAKCHRSILANIVVKVAQALGVEAELGGEI